MNLFIPVVGTKLKLKKDVKVKIKKASQNNKFAEAIEKMGDILILPGKDTVITLPKDLELIVSRVYVRQGESADFNSLTFTTEGVKGKVPKGRFFISVDDANTLDVDVVKEKEKKVPLKQQIAKKWRSYPWDKRKSCYDILDTMIGDRESCVSGTIYLDMTKEISIYMSLIHEALESKGFKNLSDAKLLILKRFSEEEFELMQNRIKDAHKVVLNKTKIPALRCQSFNINGELVLKLENILWKENEDICKSFDLFLNTLDCIMGALGRSYFYKQMSGYRTLWEDGNSSPRFGQLGWSSGPLYSSEKDSQFAYMLESYFSETYILHTKKSQEFGFIYEIDDVGEVKVSKFRKEIKNFSNK